ncbi:MAG: hypothetical protein AAB808_02260, partial [Patescibacteria group bacterium]
SFPTFPTPESLRSKEQVIAAYKKFIDRGIKSPDSLNLDDPEVQEANELFYKWQSQEDAAAAGNGDAEKRANFLKTKIYIDAGFTDPAYLGDVLGWLIQDADDVGKQSDNPERIKLRQEYVEEIKKIRGLLKVVS